MRPLFQNKTTKIDNSGVEYQLSRIADSLEQIVAHLALNKPTVYGPELDVEELSAVMYSDEVEDLIKQHKDSRIADMEPVGLYD